MSIPINYPPGVVKTVSAHTVPDRWIDCDHIRFIDGKPQKIGGYETAIGDETDGPVRGAYGWASVGGSPIANMGTWRRHYALTSGLLEDITPLEFDGNLTNPFSTTNTSTSVNVADVAHGRIVGAVVIFTGASAVGGLTIAGEYLVSSIVDDDNYIITAATPATSTAGPGGGTVASEYYLNPGSINTIYGIGYGAGFYGAGFYGTPREIENSIELELRYWFIQKYNDNVLIHPSGGTLYFWDQEAGDERAVAVTNAPTARAMFVTAEGYPVMLGTSTPMTTHWPDLDNITDWTPDASDTGNIRTLNLGNKLINGAAVADSMNLIWSDIAVYYMQFTGDSFVYRTQRASATAGLIAPGAMVVADNQAFWMSRDRFYMYDGSGVRQIPRQDEIHQWFYTNLNRTHVGKCFAAYNPVGHEIWFVAPHADATEPDIYVSVSLDDFSWANGTFDRTAMLFYPTPNGAVLMTGHDGEIFEHEVGTDADGAALDAYITGGLFRLGNGEADLDVSRVIWDMERQTGNVTVALSMYERPNSASAIDTTTLTIAETDEEGEPMLGGRHLSMTIRSNVLAGDFRMGTPALEIDPGGER